MEGFNAAVLIEMDKLLKKKKLFAAALLSVLSIVIGQIAITVIKNGFGLRITGSSEFPIAVLSVFTYTVLPLFAAFVAIDMFSGEFSANTMKLTLVRPVSRFGVFSAKVAVIAIFIAVNLFLVMLLSTLAGLLFNPSSASLMNFIRIFLSFMATLLPVFAFTLLVVLLSTILRNGLAVFFLSVLLYMGMYIVGIVFSSYSSFFITSMFGWYNLWISASFNGFKILRQLMIMSGCSIMLFTAGFWLFDRKDL